MATEDSTIPVISITATDDSGYEGKINVNPYQASPEPLTDLEDLDHDQEQPFKGKLKIKLEDDGGLTDAEVMEASDDEKDTNFMPNIAVHIDDILDYGGTYEELVRVGSPKSRFRGDEHFESVSATKPEMAKGLLNTFYEKEGVTDNEDFDLSDEEDNVDEEGEEATEDDNILERLIDDETVAISDTVRKSPVPSPSVTPEPGEKAKKGKHFKKGKHTRKKATHLNLLSPRSISPHLSDVTDTEIVYSDSEEDAMKQRPISPQERRRRQKLEDELKVKQRIIGTTGSQSSRVLPELELSKVHISERIPVTELPSESDTDNTYHTQRKHGIYAPRKKTLLMEVAGALMKETFASTDVEQFEGSIESDDDAASQVSDTHYSAVDSQSGSVKEKQLAKNRLGLPKQDRIVLTDTEDITDDETYRINQAASPSVKVDFGGDSTEEDDLETTESEYVAAVRELRARAWKDSNYEIRFIDVEGKTRPLAITPDLPHTSTSSLAPPQINLYATDTEDLDEDPIIDRPKSFLNIHSPEHDGGITDTEEMEGEEDMFRPKYPELSDEEHSQALPEPTREMILMKEDSSGRPVSVVLPLGNVEPGGLTTPRVELEGGISEVEDILTDDDEALSVPVQIPCPTPDLPEIEGGIIHTSEVVKVQKKKLKVMSDGALEPLTDTEDIFLSASGKRKRTRNKPRLGLEVNPNDIKQELTDTEDLVFSDAENRQKKHLSLPQIETDPLTDLDDVDVSGEEDILDAQRSTAITPEFLPEFESDSFTTLKEGSGPFSEEARQNFLSLSNVPSIQTISPSPDLHFINTDTEDMVASADEDGFSRAETMTPYDAAVELEDQSSFVYMKHTRKFDLEAPEEAMHVKGARDIHESHTDVEDISGVSEDERPKPPEQLFVNDTKSQVCVCLSSEVDEEDSVCVCVSKEHGGLSLVWNSKNSTDAKHHRDWAEKGKPDSSLDPSKKEGEEVLMDLAAGLQDAKGGSLSGPSSGK